MGQVIAPYDSEDARGLLKAAIRDPDPVVFLENEMLYGQAFPVTQQVSGYFAFELGWWLWRGDDDTWRWTSTPSCPLGSQMRFILEIVVQCYLTFIHVNTCQVLDKDFLLPIGKAKVQRPGKDVTLVTFSKMVGYCLTAAEELAAQGIDVEVSVWV
jgi:pyruvate/2-oxoglutarate/acetoin dehydrogenase E1 component